MAKQLMYYEKVVPISAERHRGWSVAQGSFVFAAETNAAPLMCAEFQSAACELPIVFGKTDAGFSPVVIMGIEQNQALTVASDGAWIGTYIPAFLRRYPFVFAEGREENSFTLCLDEGFDGCDSGGQRGKALYGSDGDEDEPSDFLREVLEFARNFEIEQRRTIEFGKLLEEQNLMEPMQAGITMPDGQKRAVTGFHVVSREKLKAIPEDVLKDYFARDVLELIYYHMGSLRNMEKLRRLAS
ncbi:MAG: SapC family protein [Pseudomonadota bacterium]